MDSSAAKCLSPKLWVKWVMDIPIVPKVDKRKAKEILLGTIALIMVIAVLIFPWNDANHQMGTSDWKEVQATVNVSEIRLDSYSESEGRFPYISYSYSVDGESFSNDDIVLFDLDGSYGFSTSIVDEYPYGSEITAYYNSEDPNQAVLMKGFSGVLPPIIYILQIVSVVFGAVVTFLMGWGILFHTQPTANRERAEAKEAEATRREVEMEEKQNEFMRRLESGEFGEPPDPQLTSDAWADILGKKEITDEKGSTKAAANTGDKEWWN